MNQTSRPAAAVAAFALSALPLLLIPSGAAADTAPGGGSKAQIEHDERMRAELNRPSKAQIEHDERQSAPLGDRTESRTPSDNPTSGDGNAAAWQLALAVALGATVTGGVVLVSRQAGQRRQAVAP